MQKINIKRYFSVFIFFYANMTLAQNEFIHIPSGLPGFTALPSKNVYAAYYYQNKFFVLHSYGLSESSDEGKTWTTTGNGLLPEELRELRRDKVIFPNNNVLTLEGGARVCYGTNTNLCWEWRWEKSGSTVDSIQSISLLPSGEILLGIKDFGIAKANINQEQSVVPVSEGLMSGECHKLNIATNGTLYIQEGRISEGNVSTCEVLNLDYVWELPKDSFNLKKTPLAEAKLIPHLVRDAAGNRYSFEDGALIKRDNKGTKRAIWRVNKEEEMLLYGATISKTLSGDLHWVTSTGTVYTLDTKGMITSFKVTPEQGEERKPVYCHTWVPDEKDEDYIGRVYCYDYNRSGELEEYVWTVPKNREAYSYQDYEKLKYFFTLNDVILRTKNHELGATLFVHHSKELVRQTEFSSKDKLYGERVLGVESYNEGRDWTARLFVSTNKGTFLLQGTDLK